jgi:hypothetical protein
MKNWLLLLGISLLPLLGCMGGVDADYDKLGLVDISGKITLDGAPLADAVVKFESEDKTFCYAKTDASGAYTLKLNSEKTGVIPGEKLVRISTTASTGEEEGSGQEADPDEVDKSRSKEERVPDCYHKNSKIKVQVTESDANFNFDLLSDCTVTNRS